MPLPPELLESYRNAEYVVFGDPELVLRVGERNAGVDALLEENDARTGAYVTPANPRGELWSREENLAVLESFHHSLRDTKYTCYAGEGRDPNGEWVAEPSLLVVGIELDEAKEMGRRLEQNAIVFVEKGQAPALILL